MILNRTLPYDPFATPRLPGVAPMDPGGWLHADDAHAPQMAERERLLRTDPRAVLHRSPLAEEAMQELLDTVLAALPAGYAATADAVVRPDGVRVPLKRSDPMATLGRLVQEDLCLMMRPDGASEHVLAAAVLCFPASWRLDEKADRPLTAIHGPVAEYDASLAARVQRLFDGVQPGRPLWRFNAHWYDDPALHQPRSVAAPRPPVDPGRAAYLRSERQGILRLPRTGAAVFSIHTYVLARADAVRQAERA